MSKYKTFTEIINEVWLPQALYCGCSYELFWHLNPNKLLPFTKAKRMELDNKSDLMRIASHQTGMYTMFAVASCFSKDVKYPDAPFGMEDEYSGATQGSDAPKPLTDAERFEMFMIVHNEQLKRKREQQAKLEENKKEVKTGGEVE